MKFEIISESEAQVTVRSTHRLSIPDMGHELMVFETHLRETVNPEIEVFLEPEQDKNSIRRFRGVSVV